MRVYQCPLCAKAVKAVLQHGSEFVPAKYNTPATAHVVALLDNIRSLRNVGAIFRTSDAAGIRHLYLCGITATPEHPKLAKTALGAEQVVAWSHFRNALDAVAVLQEQGFLIWVVEGGDSAESLFNLPNPPNHPIALVFGSETAGVDPAISAQADRRIAIPMRGIKQSLNVATAFGIAAYALTS